MTFTDYSAPESPSLAQQRDALRKGLGRAVLWSSAGRLANEPLLEACLCDQRFDMQIDDSRTDWLWRMVQAVGAAERFRVTILHALYDLSDERSANQLCELARRYADAGDETFRSRLFEIVEQKPFPDSPWLGEEEVVTLGGEQGFLFAARARGKLLAGREMEWDDAALIDLANKRFGEQNVNLLLNGSADEAISRFREAWRQDMKRTPEREQPRLYRDRMAATPVREILGASEGGSTCVWFRGWGIHAGEADLRIVLERLWAEREPRVIARLLKVFSGRPLPEFDARLIDLCRHDDGDVRRRAFAALEQNAHALVRDFALSELRKVDCNACVVGLFIENYRPGDENLILEALELPNDECESHWLLMDVVKVLETNPEAHCSRLGVIAYASTPCEKCRLHAAQLLLNRREAPARLVEECQHDSGEELRTLSQNLQSQHP